MMMKRTMAILRRTRTEELKAKRRIYGDGGGQCHFRDHKLSPRTDGVSNAVTTFDKDNYLQVEYE